MTAINQKNRGLPFLHRNWLKTTNHWDKMGSKASVQTKDSGDRRPDQEEDARAVKRRRIQNAYDGFPLYENYAKSQRALRIEILKVSHKDAPRVKNGIMNGLVPPNVRDVTQIKARCKLSIWGGQGGHQVMLHVDSQVCDIKVFKNPAGSSSMARFYSIKPFHIPDEKIFLERDDDAVFGLASSYSFQIELESAGDPNWPPSELVAMDDDSLYNRGLPRRQWMLTAHIADIFGTNRNRKTMRLRVRKNPNHEVSTNFLMDVDVRWVTNISSQLAMGEQTKDVLPSIMVIDPNEPPRPVVDLTVSENGVAAPTPATNGVNGLNGINGHLVNGEAERLFQNGHTPPDTPEEVVLAEGETTPSRSRRSRQDINYNVKQLWSKAIGKEARKRRKLSTEEQAQLDEHTITYLLPPEQVQTEHFGCLLCGAENERLSQLRAHYLSHPQYDFEFQPRAKGGYCVTVKPSADGPEGSPLRPKIYQLGLPVRPLDLDKLVEGDESWVAERMGPENDKLVQVNAERPGHKPTIIPRKIQRKPVLVPHTKQPLFDPLSKVPLTPGQPVPFYPIDDAWLLLKHRENLQDFIDLNPEEKEYLQEWDNFILRKHLSSQQYLPRAFNEFVSLKAAWIVESKARGEEFAKHVSLLLTRSVVGDQEISEATKVLNEARRAAQAGGPKQSGSAEKTTRKRRGGGCCGKCGEVVGVCGMVVCANKQCKGRLYHDTCTGIVDANNAPGWKCEACSSSSFSPFSSTGSPSEQLMQQSTSA
ncbi:hypothetical protein QBC43DRAFT_209483 [Cladorrhinum sp. PSN259]|nr:hypothetical protein QBC43DRAFT_209483 [Cladorrhinum sp. PSN259]